MSSDLERSLGLERTGGLAFEVLASLPETGVLVFDRELRIVVAAGRALQAHGYEARQLEGQRFADVLPESAIHGLTPHIRAALGGIARTLLVVQQTARAYTTLRSLHSSATVGSSAA